MLALGIFIGVTIAVCVLIFLPRVYRKWFSPAEKEHTYDVTFRLTFAIHPSIHGTTEARIVKTEDITIRVTAIDQEDAKAIVEEIIDQEVKPELVAITPISA